MKSSEPPDGGERDCRVTKRARSTKQTKVPSDLSRRTFLERVGRVGLLAAGGTPLFRPRISVASPVTLSLWVAPDIEPFYKMAAEEYAKTHLGFKLEILSSPLRELEQKLKASIPIDTGPDLFEISRGTAITFADAGLLPPNPPNVTALLESKAYNPVVVEYGMWKGRTYGIPLLDGAKPALFYNTRMFAEAGLDPKKPPQTFDELMGMARKLVKKDGAGNLTRAGISLRLSGQGSGVAEKFWFVLYAMGGDPIVQTQSGKWHNNYDNDAGRAALNFYIDAVHKYHVDDPQLPHDGAAFANEQAAMLMREAWLIGFLKRKAPTVQYNTVALPRAKRWGGMTQPENIFVTRNTKNSEVAWDFAQFIVSPPMAIQLVKMTGWTSLREDVDWAPLLKETPQFKPFVQWDKGRALYVEPALPVWDEIETKMAQRLTLAYADKSLLDNSAGIAKAIKEMAAETDDLLKKAGLYGTT
jgi:multiple sugar transport system substrate-binding protein